MQTLSGKLFQVINYLVNFVFAMDFPNDVDGCFIILSGTLDA